MRARRLSQPACVLSSVYLSVRADRGAPAAPGASLVDALGAVDRARSLRLIRLAQQAYGSLARERAVVVLSACFGALE